MMRFGTWSLVSCAAALAAPVALADPVLEWNDVLLETIRHVGGPPGSAARAGAILHVAIYDAVNSIEQLHEPYALLAPAPPDASREAAVAAAGHVALSGLFGSDPLLQGLFDQLRAAQLAVMPDGAPKAAGIMVGELCAAAVLQLRSADGADAYVHFKIKHTPGYWRPTSPDFTAAPMTPQWGSVTPWALTSGNQFRPVGPAGKKKMKDVLKSAAYAAAFNEVRSLGALDSTTRTAEQTLIARFWANDRDGTYKPPGQLNAITRIVAEQQANTLSENARLFALVNMALADAAIAAWDCKYVKSMPLWRPITGIREAHKDHNPNTVRDASWRPLANLINGGSPPFPAYVSGHATFAAAWAAVLQDFYGTDDMSFTITSDDTPGVYRTYERFSDAAHEIGRSRVYLGVHWQFDATDGWIMGQQVGHYVAAHYLRP